jgi:NitT/TauT family transport system permease protein
MNEAGSKDRKQAGTPLYGKELSPGWRWALRILSPLAFIALWQLLCSVHFLGATPSPVDVSRALWHLLDQGDPIFGRSIWAHILNSLYRVLAGFAIAALAGVGLGLLMGWYRVVYYILHPLVEMLRPIPPFAWIVLAILWFKIGNAPAIFIVFLGAFFPILLNTVSGVESFDRVLGEAAVTLGASRHQVLKKVVLPSALPQIFTGLRVGLGVGWMSLIAAEMVGVGAVGLGLMIQSTMAYWRLDYAVAFMAIIGAMGFMLDFLMRRIERYYLRWR